MICWAHPEFLTVTCLDWRPLLKEDKVKRIIINSLEFLVINQRAHVYSFVVMDTHFHLIWQIIGENRRGDVQRDFLKFTAQHILKELRNTKSAILDDLVVNSKDRKRQVWERDSLGIPLWSNKVFAQKLDYIHMNPVVAGICALPEDYTYSSAGFYFLNDNRWDFLTPANV